MRWQVLIALVAALASTCQALHPDMLVGSAAPHDASSFHAYISASDTTKLVL